MYACPGVGGGVILFDPQKPRMGACSQACWSLIAVVLLLFSGIGGIAVFASHYDISLTCYSRATSVSLSGSDGVAAACQATMTFFSVLLLLVIVFVLLWRCTRQMYSAVKFCTRCCRQERYVRVDGRPDGEGGEEGATRRRVPVRHGV